MPPRLDSEACLGIQKKTLQELRGGNADGLVSLHYRFSPALGSDRKHVVLSWAQFRVIGLHNEGEEIPVFINELRKRDRLYQSFINADSLGDYIASNGAVEPTVDLAFDLELDRELSEINHRFSAATRFAFPTEQVIQELWHNNPEQTRKFFIVEAERQIKQFERYCAEYQKGYEGEVRSGISPRLIPLSEMTEIQYLKDFLSLLKDYKERLVTLTADADNAKIKDLLSGRRSDRW